MPLLALVALVGVLAGCRVTRADPQRPGPAAQAARQDQNNGGVSTRTLSLTDAARGRSFTARVFYPTDAQAPLPIVVFSHGLRGTPDDYRNLIARWVRDGLVVLAPAYPFTNREAAEIQAGDLRNQPADASFALTSLLEQAEQSANDPLHGRLDPNHVAAAGHSEGALTTYGLFTACCRDARLSAGIVMAGDAVGFRDQPMSGKPAPLLFIHGDADQVVAIELGRAAYARVPWPKAFLTLPGAGHIPPYLGGDSPAADTVSTVSTSFLRWTQRNDPAALDTLRRTANTAIFDDAL